MDKLYQSKQEYLENETIYPFLQKILMQIDLGDRGLEDVPKDSVLGQILLGQRKVKFGNPDTCSHTRIFKVRDTGEEEYFYCLLCGYRIYFVDKKKEKEEKKDVK